MNEERGYRMEPRVFVSSTFYDLKHVRESLGNFIEGYGFKPVLFENGDVGYELMEELDQSCYSEMRNCDMAILIIGGRYGSPASDQKSRMELSQDQFKEYQSVTCKEFSSAIRANVPVYVFIDSTVDIQYKLYRDNISKFDTDNGDFVFAGIDSINVFRFIHSIRAISHLQIETFSKVNDITNYLKKQWAALFRSYLRSRKEIASIKQVETPMHQMVTKLDQIETLLKTVSEKVIGSNTEEYQSVILDNSLENAAGTLASCFEFLMFVPSPEKINNYLLYFVDRLIAAYDDKILDYPFSGDSSDFNRFCAQFEYEDVQITAVKSHLAYEPTIFDIIKQHKPEIVSKLMQPKYLQMMKLV